MNIPSQIGRYEIRKELGRGMMGIVYEAYDPALGRRIALKTIRLAFAVSEAERRAFEERFLTEARVAARLSHPGIVVVHDVGQDEKSGTLYIALEYLVGRTLSEIASDRKPLEWREVLRITKGVAEALHHAHSEGVIHRDIKPANVMILASGDPKIMDFGIAKVESNQLTSAGQFFGTPLYMSPEQALGRTLDSRSDLFSVGSLAYRLLTGREAFEASGVPRIITRVIQEDPPPPTTVVRRLPKDLDYFIARALAKDPSDRYPTGRAMAEDADDLISGRPPRNRAAWVPPTRAPEGTMVSAPSPAKPKAASEPARPARRRRSYFFTTLSFGVLLGGFAVAWGLQLFPGSPEVVPATPAVETPAASPVPTPTPEAAVPSPEPSLAVASPPSAQPSAEPAPTAAPEEEPPPTTAPVAPKGAPTHAPAEARAVPHAAPKPSTHAEPTSYLAIDFEHTLEEGTLRVWVDDALVVDQALDSRVTKKMVLTFRKGSVAETLKLNSGMHDVTVQVAWEGNSKTKRIAAHFQGGVTRHLSAKMGVGVRGLVHKDLNLEWR